MSILLDENTRVIVQGITGRDGSFHTKTMVQDGTNIVAGVTPGKGGQSMDGITVYNSVEDCLKEHEVDASVIFVPAPFAAGAAREAIDAGIALVVCITEGVPVQEMTELYHRARKKGSVLIGPNCPGLISPGKSKIGIMPLRIHKAGGIGVISRSGTLTYEVVNELTLAGMGQSSCIGIGGDPIVGSGFVDLLERFEADTDTTAVVLIGEIGGEAEEEAALYIKEKMTKPVVSFISGRSAPKGKRMGHAGAIISGGKGTAEAKVAAFIAAGVDVADKPDEIPGLLRKKMI
ncbi:MULTISPECIES: succinate--CoA ligase subunit alpha [unclassified Oceanispirochaeta]|uniref:succinate--CoA ligase subunit alpha n=1 Tax=unclassified Oceanispirochaeta TaxID=2635722 RepID=UPI000E095CA8|nr:MULTISPECIES: succinate--CoA ligase subunit alpha [unclassified Oceanispirochaeta]MBF9017489.1 succinate--CoA ligase subunit alpha [Oceanispirochaeta sp. M2]NPD74061.1 succinate--CoA ligase subunit alpha [Oceanispirochaeta sp. M1]RDG30103.1 succinate--CoA ligase subunit alpha [Oceanispirochaeta sp. M1]